MRAREIMEYVLETPQNINPAILKAMIESYGDRVQNELFDYTVDVDIADSVDLLGKKASDLQKDVIIEDGKFYGTLHHVTDYTGFSGNAKEQKGWYVTFHVESDNATSIKVNGVTLDSDGIHILWFDKPKKGKAIVELIGSEGSVTDTFDCSGLKFE